jgi:hypothetical protein
VDFVYDYDVVLLGNVFVEIVNVYGVFANGNDFAIVYVSVTYH